MPKPKRPRPPIVKTDWVVEVEFKSPKHKDAFYWGDDMRGAIKWAKGIKETSVEVTCYERKWRKVDL